MDGSYAHVILQHLKFCAVFFIAHRTYLFFHVGARNPTLMISLPLPQCSSLSKWYKDNITVYLQAQHLGKKVPGLIWDIYFLWTSSCRIILYVIQ